MPTAVSGLRRLPSWLSSFVKWTDAKPSPEIFRRWAGISTLAGVLERRVWVQTYGEMVLYPNIFVFLVGHPASGKSVALNDTRMLWKTLPDLHVSPTSMTAASLGDDLAAAQRKIVRPASIPPYVDYNSLLIASPELGVLMPGYDGELMIKLTDLWNCGVYEESRRTRKEKLVIPRSQLNMIAATTPSYLNNLLPPGAWDQGFISRVIMVFSAESIHKTLFENIAENESLRGDLVSDLTEIGQLFGKMNWTAEAAKAIVSWDNAGNEPIPNHPRLQHYNSRRTEHLLKLCMIACVNRSDCITRDGRITITFEDYSTALDWLLEAELFMPDIFKSMTVGGDAASIDETFHYIFSTYMAEKRPLAEHRLIHFIKDRVPAHSVLRVVEMLIRSNMIEVTAKDEKGRNLYKPIAKALHSS